MRCPHLLWMICPAWWHISCNLLDRCHMAFPTESTTKWIATILQTKLCIKLRVTRNWNYCNAFCMVYSGRSLEKSIHSSYNYKAFIWDMQKLAYLIKELARLAIYFRAEFKLLALTFNYLNLIPDHLLSGTPAQVARLFMRSSHSLI